MPYEKSGDKLENFIARAMNEGEIRNGVNRADLDESDLRKRFVEPSLEEKGPKIWEAAASEIETYDQVEHAYKARLAELRGEEVRLRRSYLRMSRRGMVAVLVTLPVILLSFTFILFRYVYAIELSPTGLITILIILVLGSLVYVALCRNLYRRYLASKERYDERLAEIQRELESNALSKRLEKAEQDLERA